MRNRKSCHIYVAPKIGILLGLHENEECHNLSIDILVIFVVLIMGWQQQWKSMRAFVLEYHDISFKSVRNIVTLDLTTTVLKSVTSLASSSIEIDTIPALLTRDRHIIANKIYHSCLPPLKWWARWGLHLRAKAARGPHFSLLFIYYFYFCN